MKESLCVAGLNEFARDVHENAVAHGWWETEREFGTIIALCHSELSEALEEHRSGRPMIYCGSESKECETAPTPDTVEVGGKSFKTPCVSCNLEHKKPEGVAIELADCIIRILDYCGHAGIDIEEAIRIKHEYNKTRPYRHGGKKC